LDPGGGRLFLAELAGGPLYLVLSCGKPQDTVFLLLYRRANWS
jgi:hypothetical protein